MGLIKSSLMSVCYHPESGNASMIVVLVLVFDLTLPNGVNATFFILGVSSLSYSTLLAFTDFILLHLTTPTLIFPARDPLLVWPGLWSFFGQNLAKWPLNWHLGTEMKCIIYSQNICSALVYSKFTKKIKSLSILVILCP